MRIEMFSNPGLYMNPTPRGTKQLFDHPQELIELVFGPSSFYR